MSTTATDRVLNFSAGPATLPEPVLAQAREDLWNIAGSGIGICEHSHRGPVFDRVIDEAIADCREVGGIGDEFEVLFLQGGASLQFTMVPMNLLPEGGTADYIDTGTWATKAIQAARLEGDVHVAFDGSQCEYDHCPTDEEIVASDSPAYLHYCSNNTICGTQFSSPPTSSGPVICDMSSDMFSRPIDWSTHAMTYAGAQKNLGPAGTVLVVICKDLLTHCREGIAPLLSYPAMAAKGSRLNTPPTFGIYLMGQVFKWIKDRGGLAAMAEHNEAKAAHVYDALCEREDAFSLVAREGSRSNMNITFRTTAADADAAFLAAAADVGMSGLKGHRSVGGLRASIYNAFPEEGCKQLAQFIRNWNG